jgi:hypothetical protein
LPALDDPPKTNAEVHERLLSVIGKLPKAHNNLKRVWKPLSDGAEHKIEDVAREAVYSVKTPIFKDSIKLLVEDLGFAVRDGSKKTIKLRDFLFPFAKADSVFLDEVVSI